MIDIFTLEYLLPFMLVIAVVYGGLESVQMFRNRAIKTIIAVVVGFFALTNYQIVQTINSFLPYAAIFFVLVFGLGFARKALSGDGGRDNTMLIIVIALVLLFIASLTLYGGNLYQYNEFLWLIGIIAVAAIFYAAYKMK